MGTIDRQDLIIRFWTEMKYLPTLPGSISYIYALFSKLQPSLLFFLRSSQEPVTFPPQSKYQHRYLLGKTLQIDLHFLQHFLGQLTDHPIFALKGLVLLLYGLIELRNKILAEVEEWPGGGLLGVEVKLWIVDVADFKIPEELLLAAVELKFPHLECHL